MDICLSCKLKTKDATRLLRNGIIKWGKDLETVLIMEELAELTSEIGRALRGRKHKVAEEMADVYIMLRTLELIFNCEKESSKIIDKKLVRLQERINE
jgi:NTP pyrophosphatase (non-canonical NTP hydrolase)